MLSRRPTLPARRRVRRALPALALGVGALALTLPTALPSAAVPRVPVAGTSGTAATSSTTTSRAVRPVSGAAKGQHLTAAAKRAGLQPGNATMGWRQRGAERAIAAAPRLGMMRSGQMVAASRDQGFVPKGVLGIDVSSYQGNVDWSTWTALDKRFAYIKATEGTSYRSPTFRKQYRSAAKAGLIRGAYHFANPGGKHGYTQARYFVRHGGGWSADGHTLPGVLDIEYNPYGKTCYGVSKKKMVTWIRSFTTEYKRLTGKDAVIYSTTDWWKTCTGNTDAFAQTNPLWIARYGTKKPGTLPKGWTYATFWQYSANPIDQDVFGNKMKRLRVLATKI